MILAYLELVRPLVSLAYAGLVMMGFFAVGFPSEDPASAALTMACVAVLAMGAAAINDVYDAPIDRINAPSRPIPSGRISPAGARRAAAVLFATGLAVGGVSFEPAVAAGLASGGLGCVLYGFWSKRMGPAKNILIAAMAAAACLLPGVAMGRATPPLVLAAVHAFLVGWAVEVVKDVGDAAGDASVGARTWPVVAGPERAMRAARVAAALGFLVAFFGAASSGPGSAVRLALAAGGSVLAAAALAGVPGAKPATLLMGGGALGLGAIVLFRAG